MKRLASIRSIGRVAALLVLTAGCIGDVEVPPKPPGLFPVESPTRRARQQIEGTKPEGTAVLDHGEIIVPHDDMETWYHTLSLQPGENQIDLTSQKPSGKESREHTTAVIVYEPNFPAQPTLDQVASPTNQQSQTIGGTKPRGTSLELRELDASGGEISAQEIVEPDDETGWSHQLTLGGDDGIYYLSLVARDARSQYSEPVDFEIELDRVPPAIRCRYPVPDDADVPTNTLVSVGMDGALAVAVDDVNRDILVLREGGNRLSGALLYNPFSYSLVLAAPLGAGMTYTLTLDPALFTDEAGNRTDPAPGDWTWQFTTGAAADNTTPATPFVDPLPQQTTDKEATLSGGKQGLTSVWINGRETVALNDSTSWTCTWPLSVGENDMWVTAKSRAGIESSPAHVQIVREAVKPNPPVVDPVPPGSVDDPVLTLEGTRDANTSILYNGLVVVPRGPDTNWVFNADLVPGVNEIELRARDADLNLSEPVHVLVDFVQEYEGPVQAGFKLVISFSLRDLSGVDPIRTSFDTGPNQYSIDAWVEGPLEPAEACEFDHARKERRNIDYVATITHYIGRSEGHTNPFWDADYRAPDYLAVLVTAGMFEHLGIGPGADRRDDATGFQGGDLTDQTGRIRITTQDLRDHVDGVTEATISDGLKVIEWLPLDRDLQRIQQGEYMIRILVSLDRDPAWVANNDLETCWANPDHAGQGQHRIVRRMGLGSIPYSVTVGQASEMAGPDVERGADQLRYVTPEGVTFRWVKTD